VNVLVDSSVWIDYFRGGKKSKDLTLLIDENLICTNDLVLSELVPPLTIRKEKVLVSLLYDLTKIDLDINWTNVIKFQITCLSNGINKVGVPDLCIVANVINNGLILFTLDKHFKLMSEMIEFDMWKN
jgi:predicted nucleic acid-binding protein